MRKDPIRNGPTVDENAEQAFLRLFEILNEKCLLDDEETFERKCRLFLQIHDRGEVIDEFLFFLVTSAQEAVGAEASSLLLLDKDSKELFFKVALGEKAAEIMKYRVPLGQGIVGVVAQTGQAILLTEATSDPRFFRALAEQIEYIPQFLLCVPIFKGDSTIGVLEVLTRERKRPFTEEDSEALKVFADALSYILEDEPSSQRPGMAENLEDHPGKEKPPRTLDPSALF